MKQDSLSLLAVAREHVARGEPWLCLTAGSIRISREPGSQETLPGLATVSTDMWLCVIRIQRK